MLEDVLGERAVRGFVPFYIYIYYMEKGDIEATGEETRGRFPGEKFRRKNVSNRATAIVNRCAAELSALVHLYFQSFCTIL